MRLTIETKKFVEYMDLVSRFVSRSATLPILENVLLKVTEGSLQLIATDMEKFIKITFPVDAPDCAITINAKTLADYVRMIDDDTITFGVDMQTDFLTIKSSRDDLKIRGISASEFVVLPSLTPRSSLHLSASHFSEGISKVEFAIKEKHHMPIITGLLLRHKVYDGVPTLVFTGTDSLRLAEYKIPTVPIDGELNIVIPKTNIGDIQRVVEYFHGSYGEDVELQIGDNLVGFVLRGENVSCEITSVLIKGNYPPYENEKVMPTTFSSSIALQKDELDKAIRKVGLLNKNIDPFVTLSISPEAVMIDSGYTDLGEAKSSLRGHMTGNPVAITFNGKFLQDAIKVVGGTELTISIVGPGSPVIIKDTDVATFTYVVKTKS